MAELSLAQAATLAGKSKSTLTRAIKSGRMSAVRRADGTFGIDPAELLRVFPTDAVRSGASASDSVAPDAVVHAAQQVEISTLRDDLATARQQAAVAQALADERARALEAAERNLADLRRMLPAPSGSASARPWWRFWS
jgi:predicted DNA-binding protein (UPF0251 family)